MEIKVKRFEFGDHWTIGKLYLNDNFECFTLEDKVRVGTDGKYDSSLKIKGATAIPTGTYRVVIDMSTRFGRNMPHILDVPNFEGIRIHSGNSDVDTEGCILLGTTWSGGDFIGQSRIAFGKFFLKLQADEYSTITIS